jgi:hypothetical protein
VRIQPTAHDLLVFGLDFLDLYRKHVNDNGAIEEKSQAARQYRRNLTELVKP